MKKLRSLASKYGFIVYPVLFAIFPLLSFYGANVSETQAVDLNLWAFIIFNFIVVVFAWLISWILTASIRKASILSILFLAIFFTFGSLDNLLQGVVIDTPVVPLGPKKILFIVYLIIIGAAWFLLRRLSEETTAKVNKMLLMVSAFLVASSLFTVIIGVNKGGKDVVHDQSSQTVVNTNSNQELPDIYYILLDGYAREDHLKENFKLDNSDFIGSLENKGFYVADKANSNYPHTHLSVPSTLDMNYLQKLSEEVGPDYDDRAPLFDVIKNNQTVPLFKQLGYKYVQVGSHWWWTNTSENADIEVESNKYNSNPKLAGVSLDEFAVVYLQTTMLKPLVSTEIKDTILNRILAAFDRTAQVSGIAEPTLTFTHIVSPHPPYLFNREGIIEGKTNITVNNEDFLDREAYADQTVYINKLTLELVDEILNKSDRPPIIIIASDHGPASSLAREDWKETDVAKMDKKAIRERLGILNAYLIPDNKGNQLYPEITPVNSFRYLLKNYFNQNIDLLPDQSFFADRKINQYRFTDVTKLVNE